MKQEFQNEYKRLYGKEIKNLDAIWEVNEILGDVIYDMEINKIVTVWTRFGYADLNLNQFDSEK